MANNAATYVPSLIVDATDEPLRNTINGSLMSASYFIRDAIRIRQPHGTDNIVSRRPHAPASGALKQCRNPLAATDA